MTSLDSNVKWPHGTSEGLIKLLHVYDQILFAAPGDWDGEVWYNSLRTVERALFRARMDAVLNVVGRQS